MAELYQVLFGLQGVMTLWMLLDAYRRQADPFWYFIILCVPPFGPWIYLLANKGADLPHFNLGGLLVRRVPLDRLRYQAEQVPTLATHLALAERLIERGEHEEALPYLDSAHQREPGHCQVLYSLALCHFELGRPEQAIPFLEQVIARDRSWSDYSAWRLIIRARGLVKDAAGALQNCRDLARYSPTLQHRCLLAEHLLEAELHQEAYDLMEQALEDYRYAPSVSRRRYRSWVSQARRLHKRAADGG